MHPCKIIAGDCLGAAVNLTPHMRSLIAGLEYVGFSGELPTVLPLEGVNPELVQELEQHSPQERVRENFLTADEIFEQLPKDEIWDVSAQYFREPGTILVQELEVVLPFDNYPDSGLSMCKVWSGYGDGHQSGEERKIDLKFDIVHDGEDLSGALRLTGFYDHQDKLVRAQQWSMEGPADEVIDTRRAAAYLLECAALFKGFFEDIERGTFDKFLDKS